MVSADIAADASLFVCFAYLFSPDGAAPAAIPPHSPTPIPVLTVSGAAGAKANSLQLKPSFLRLLATVLLALPAFSAPPEASDPLTKGLRATLKPDNAEFKTNIEAKLKCSVKNTSDAAVTLDTSVFQSAILCLGVFNADGKRLPTVPPPFPLGPDARKKFMKSLAPGEQYEVEISIYVFSPPLVPGTYSARVKNMESNTVKFKILEKMN